MSIDVSTHELGEQTCRLLNSKVPIEGVLKVWYGCGAVVSAQLQQRKGVRLGALGTFSLTSGGEPTFVMAPELASQFKIKFRPLGAADNIPTTSINFTQLSQVSGVARDVCDKVYGRFVNSIGRSILEGRNVLVSVSKVAEITISAGVMSCEFIPSFISIFKPNVAAAAAPTRGSVMNSEQKALAAAKAARAMKLLGNAGGPPTPGALRGATREADRKPAQKPSTANAAARLPPPPPREPNNIFGDGTEETNKAPPPRERNPIIHGDEEGFDHNPFDSYKDFKGLKSPPRPPSAAGSVRSNGTRPSADTLSLLHSPRSRPSSAGSQPGFGVGRGTSTGGLRKEMLEKQQRLLEQQQLKQQQQARRPGSGNHAGAKGSGALGLDARAAAAKALDVGDIVQKLREKIVARGGSNGIKTLQKLLAIMDNNGDKRLDKEELKYGLRDYGVDLSPTELDQVFLYFDSDRNGFIDVTEFLVGIRGELSERRKKLVRMAFNILDTDGSGFVTVDEIAEKYDMSWNPDVRSGKKTMKEAIVEFMEQWEKGGEKDGIITPEEFENYYKDLSASIDDDDYFELMIRNAWRIAGGEGAAANTANRRVLVTDKHGNQRVETVNHELGMNKKDMNDIKSRLAKQGVDAANVDLYGGLDATDKPKPRSAAAAAAAPAPRPSAAGGSSRPPSAPVAAPAPAPRSSAAPAAALPRGSPRPSSSSSSAPQAAAPTSGSSFDAFAAIRRVLYDPPISYDALGGRLQISVAATSPRVPMGAFLARIATLDSSLSRAQIQQMWRSLDPNNVGSIELTALYEILSSKFGKDKKSSGTGGVIERVIAKILERCGAQGGIKALGRTLAIMDTSGDKKLDKEELKYGLRDYGIELNIREMDEVFLYFDRDRSGSVSVDEFLVGIRGDLNERRKKLVRMAFNILDTDGSGFVTSDEIVEKYDFTQNPEVLAGKLTIQEATLKFMEQWEKGGEKDGIITPEEFEDYYKEVSASIDGDDYFELMIRNAWRIAGGEGAAANTANRRVLVTDKHGNQRVETVNHELGMNKKDMNDIKSRLAKQGVDAANVDLYGGLDATDKPKPRSAAAAAAAPASRPSARGGGNAVFPSAPSSPSSARAGGGARDAFTRNMAAIKLAAAFRGRQGRKAAAAEKRKADAIKRQQDEIDAEQSRPKATKLIRPQPKRR